MKDFDTALMTFMVGAQRIITAHYSEKFPNCKIPLLSISKGRKYYKLIDGSTVWAFIDAQSGDVLKPASWSAPAKHARGNIFDEHNGLKYIDAYGPMYLR